MEPFYLVALVLLFIFAVVDLFVGVSNDAVNFLNSAIGSRVASRSIILLVASVGIFAGAMLSTGMMEVVRKGIFNPGHFYFSDIVIILTAVMIADILLLDFFNTIAMPTSTTVSVVFELFGAAVFTAILKLVAANQAIDKLGQYINTGKALVIISGILLSVVVAFVVGALVQYFSRIIFSFHYQKRYKLTGIIWAGLAMTAMCYFLLYKGMKSTYKILDHKQLQAYVNSGSPSLQRVEDGHEVWVVDQVVYRELHEPGAPRRYLTGNFSLYRFTRWVQGHFTLVLIGLLLFWSFVMLLLVQWRINMLRVVVLFGTFCLAMAFAGNDLVNFIGVPIAGYQSYHLWSASGLPASAYTMGGLSKSVPIPLYFLSLAALVMVLTLWFSKKARSVTDTEVNLARQEEGEERFSSSLAAQRIVKAIRNSSRVFFSLFPKRFLVGVEQKFKRGKAVDDKAAFDLVRASVNLTVASILIAIATSYKLPLSTTYVSFMVAMGTSLSDRAWDRESAVYRVSGVMQVIGGWFLTAFIAFFTAGFFALLIYYFHLWATLALSALAFFVLYRSALFHRKKQGRKDALQAIEHGVDELTLSLVVETATENIQSYGASVKDCYSSSLSGLFKEKEKPIKKERKNFKRLQEEFDVIHNGVYRWIKRAKTDDPTPGVVYLEVYDYFATVMRCVRAIADVTHTHVKNSHKPLSGKQKAHLKAVKADFEAFLETMWGIMQTQDMRKLSSLEKQKEQALEHIDEAIEGQVSGMIKGKHGIKSSHTNLTILLKTRDALCALHRLMEVFKAAQDQALSAVSPR